MKKCILTLALAIIMCSAGLTTAVLAASDIVYSGNDFVITQTLLPGEYESVWSMNEEALFATRSDGKSGLIDRDGNAIIPLEYDYLYQTELEDENGWITYTGFKTDEDAYFSVKGGVAKRIDSPPERAVFDGFFDGLKPDYSSDNRTYGYIDRAGNVVIPHEYEDAGYFTDGIASVKKNGKYGCINANGKIVVPFVYDRQIYFLYSIAIVVKDGRSGVIDRSGGTLIPFEYDSILDNFYYSEDLILMRVVKDKKYGAVDAKTGRIIAQPEYDALGLFDGELMAAKKDGKWGFIDKSNATVIAFNYDNVQENFIGDYDGFWDSQLACVAADGKWGYIDKTGRVIVPLENDKASSFLYDLAAVSKNGRYYSLSLNAATPDVPSAWASAEIAAAISTGLVPETLQKNYTSAISRGDAAQMFINLIEHSSGMSIDAFMEENGVSMNSSIFSDTTDTAVLAANALGIINGIGNDRFDPDGTITRAQVAAIINRVARVLGVNTDGHSHGFTDVVGHWVDAELGWPVFAEIVNGVGDNQYNPDGQLTTEQVIAISYRAYQSFK